MWKRYAAATLIAAIIILEPLFATCAADKGAPNQEAKAAGILIEGKKDWILVKVDGEEAPSKFIVDASDKKLVESLKGIFDACRVQLSYKKEGDVLHLVTIKRQILKTTGTVTGDVVKVYNDFWVEVKPKTGVADAYAPGVETYQNKDFMERLKGLKPGDSVTITFTTDFERHRIKTLRKNSAAGPRESPPK